MIKLSLTSWFAFLMSLAALIFGVYALLIGAAFDPSSSVGWVVVVVGWLPVLFSLFLGYYAIRSMECDIRRISFDIAVRVMLSLWIFVWLEENVTASWSVNLVVASIFLLTTSTAAASRHYNRLLGSARSSEAAFYGMVVSAAASIVAMVVYMTLFAIARPIEVMAVVFILEAYALTCVVLAARKSDSKRAAL